MTSAYIVASKSHYMVQYKVIVLNQSALVPTTMWRIPYANLTKHVKTAETKHVQEVFTFIQIYSFFGAMNIQFYIQSSYVQTYEVTSDTYDYIYIWLLSKHNSTRVRFLLF